MASYIEPRTRATGERITADDWNTDVVENIKALRETMPSGIPVGTILPYAGSNPPAGWIWANGQACNRITFSALFSVIGTTYGAGDGSTTFLTPDMRGRLPLGRENMFNSAPGRVTDPAALTLGGAGGADKHTLTVAEIPSHTHSYTHVASGGAQIATTGGTASVQSATTGAQGGGNAHNNMPPYLVLNYIIKAV